MRPTTFFRQLASDRIWFVPLISAIGAAFLAVALARITVPSEHILSNYLWPGDNAAAADMLNFIASSMLTVLTTTISMTLIVLQVASGQFSHQLLRDYIQSRAVKGIFSVFIAVFIYSILLLRSVEAESREHPPQIAMTVALMLVVLALGTFVWYVSRVVAMVRVDNIIETASRHVERLHGRHRSAWEDGRAAPTVPDHAAEIRSPDAGYVRGIDTKAAGAWAKKNDATVVMAVTPGDPVINGQVLGWAFGRGGRLDEEMEIPQNFIQIEHERVSEEDVRLGLHQLSDIAVRAMSPGTNDPTTAIHAINNATALMRIMVTKPLQNEVIEEEGELFAWTPAPTPIDFLEELIPTVRRYSSQEPLVLVQLLRLLAVVEEGTDDEEICSYLQQQREHILTVAEKDLTLPSDFQWVKSMATVEGIQSARRIAGPSTDLVKDEEDEEA